MISDWDEDENGYIFFKEEKWNGTSKIKNSIVRLVKNIIFLINLLRSVLLIIIF